MSNKDILAIDRTYLEELNHKKLLEYTIIFMEKCNRLEQELKEKNSLLEKQYLKESTQ